MANYPVSVIYDDESDMQEGSFNLNAVLLLKIEITTNPTKMTYYTGETMNYAGLVVTATYDDESTAVITSGCVITPAAGEAFESLVEIVYAEGQDEKSCSLSLTEIVLQRIYIASQPIKTEYKSGETLDYRGLVIKAVYSDEAEVDITNQCSFSAQEGTVFNPDTDTSVEISYLDCSVFLNLTEITLTGIEVTSNPTKTAYKSGEAIDYTGLEITASYSDGSTEIVTNLCTITPRAGKAFDPDTDTSIEISYLDGSESATASIALSEVYLTGISVTTNPTKMSYEAGEIIDYTGMEVTASYSDGSSKVVTSSCTITPRAGKVFDPDTDSSAEISYTEDGEEFTTNIMLVGVYPVSIEVTTNPSKTAYKHSENITYSGMVVTASYSDGSTRDVTSDCSMHPRAGKRFDADEDTNVTINYTEGSIDLTCSLTLTSVSVTGLQITRSPYKVAYQSGEQIYYSGIIVTATYSDSSTDDVSSLCDYSVMWGKHFDPATDTNITITYTEGDDEVSCTLTLIEVSMELVVETPPTETTYHEGSEVDYTGAVIKAVHTDGSTHNVTDYCSYIPEVNGEETTIYVKCALPETPYVFDQNSGYVDNGTWKFENPTNTYIGIYRVTAGHKYLLAIGSNVGSRFRAMFTTTDVSTATTNVSGTAIINKNNPSANATVSYTPTSSGYIVVGKDNVGKTGVRTFLYDANSQDKKIVTIFNLTTGGIVESIAVTPPVKLRYRSGETYDYGGAVVTAVYSDGTTEDVTEKSTFNPPNGSLVTSNDTTSLLPQTVNVSFCGKEDSFNLNVGGVALVSLELTLPPDKTVYYLRETLDFTGCVVSAVYFDGSKKDVTDKVTFDRSEMTDVAIEDEYSDMTRNIPVTIEITYEETDEEVSNLLDYDISISSSGTNASPTEYKTGIERNTPKPWTIDPPHYTPATSTGIYEATYVDVQTMETKTLRYELKSQGSSIHRELPEGKISDYWTGFDGSDPYEGVTSYEAYWQYASIDPDYGSYDSRQFGILTKSATVELGWGAGFYDYNWYMTWWAYVGAISPIKTSFKPLLQLSYGFEASTSMNLYCKMIRSLSITPPTKSSYHYSEPFDPTGITAAATFTDGEVRDVTSEVTITPSQGTSLTASRTGRVVYRNAFGSDYEDQDFNITVIKLQGLSITPPTKTSYRYGETIDYTGVSVVAVYSDDSREEITASATFSIAAGTAITGDTNVTVSYTNQWTETTTGNISLTLASVISISASNPTKTEYVAGEAIDYSGMVVTASYSDGTTADVTSSCTITPRAGKAFNPSTDTVIHIEYDTGTTTLSAEVNFGVANLESIEVTANPTKMHYDDGEIMDYTGLVVTASYSNGNSWEVTDSCTITPIAGKSFDSGTDTTVAISYTDNGVTQTADLTLLTGGLERIDVTRYMDSPCTTLMDYTGIEVTATFSDGTSDVTDACTFSPAQGHVAEDTVTITYTADSVTKTCTLQLARIPLGIEVTTLPTKTSYAPGETADYSGAVVKMSYRNRISRTVTECCDFSPAEGDTINEATTVNVSCPSSIEPYASDFTGYGASYGNWKSGIDWPSDVYKVIAGHRYLLIGNNSYIVQKNYVAFFETDVTKATSDVAGTAVTVTSPTVHFTPSADGYLAVTKYNKNTGVNNHLYDIDSMDKSKTVTFAITVTTLTGISITNNPTKTEYVPGESIDYSGLVVMASYSDGSSLDVTSKCSITPSAGKAFDPSTDTNAAITYMDKTLSLTLTVATLTGIAVTTEPLKTQYVSGHHADYTGIVVTSTYSNGSTFDVTDSCTFSPAQGETVSDTVTITHNDGTNTASCSLSLIVTSYSLVVETPPTKTTYTPGEDVDYSGAVIKMVYSDGTEHNVTDFCSYTPVVDGETTTVTVSCAPAEEYDNTVVAKGHIGSNPWYWYPSTDSKYVVRIYQAIAGHRYLLAIGIEAARLEAIFTTSDISQATLDIAATGLRDSGVSSCYSYAYSPSANGFINVCTYINYPKESPQYIYDADDPNKSVSTTFTLTTVE